MFRRYRDYKVGEFYVVFADTAWGGVDYCSAQFISKDALDVPVVYHARELASDMTPRIHAELNEIYRQTKVKPVVAFERNNGGVAELQRLERLNRDQNYIIYKEKSKTATLEGEQDSGKLGWTTSTATRPTMLSGLKDAVDNKLIRLYDQLTIEEMFSFVIKQTANGWRAEAESGAHDDLIMALAGAWQLYQTEEPPRKYDTSTTSGNVTSLFY